MLQIQNKSLLHLVFFRRSDGAHTTRARRWWKVPSGTPLWGEGGGGGIRVGAASRTPSLRRRRLAAGAWGGFGARRCGRWVGK